ncbi:SDR family NAD(P)-dependent oxidoreductase [Candidatus Nitrosotenuis chungbukensis]|uniref:SDR family NAD(P)-dependent oxidoreductase n=1 Tax=Candidatus Nitrosotenuis chungbukensis TaxID=1353246 RepID=UPI0026736F43|nr:SDR family NAD(P)-dependent oxidoreductase [Candidatus Nitrosotenuis chungbukensis]WKT58300.1 SDR family NAD(P)-dependent oxidoreductase [Candidatus Nitrosotenuis chungbukensis]
MLVDKEKIRDDVKGKTILITGGAGSIGSEITRELLRFPVKTIRVFDSDEYSLYRLSKSVDDARVRFLLGSILDKDRLEVAGQNVDIIIHTAAVKNIEITEFNPLETIDINVIGLMNLIKMAMRNKPKKFLNISTDKAAEATTLYGSTKSLGEKLTTWAGQHVTTTKFATARFGNVMETRGNVFELWREEKERGKPLSITHPDMKRYFFNVNEACKFCIIMHISNERRRDFCSQNEII